MARIRPAEIGLFLVVAGSAAVGLVAITFREGLVRPTFAVKEPNTLVVLSSTLSIEEFAHLSQHAGGLSELAASRSRRVRGDVGGSATPVFALLVSGNYFSLLGVGAVRGRVIDETDAATHASVVVVREGALPVDVGDTIRLRGVPFVVVGAVSRDFKGLSLDFTPDLFVPFSGQPAAGAILPGPLLNFVPKGGFLDVVARKAPSSSPSAVTRKTQIALAAAPGARFVASAESGPWWQPLAVAALPKEVRLPISDTLLFLGIAVVSVQVLCVANVAILVGLQLLNRRGDLAVRRALGASKEQLVREIAGRWLAVATLGVVCSLPVAIFWLEQLREVRVSNLVILHPRLDLDVWLGGPLLAALALVAPVIASIWLTRLTKMEAAPLGRAPVSPLRQQLGPLRVLTVLQLALAVGVLGTASLAVKTFVARTSGAGLENLTYARLDIDLSGYQTAEVSSRLARATSALQGLPGAVDVSLATTLPLQARFEYPIAAGNRSDSGASAPHKISTYFVSRSYFRTMHMALTGATFHQDARREEAVPNTKASRLLWGEQNPVGRTIRVGGGVGDLVVVGVVTGEHKSLFAEEEPRLYLPLGTVEGPHAFALVRGNVGKESLRAALRGAVGDIPIGPLLTMEEHLGRYWSRARLLAIASGTAGALATLLALWGLYVTARYCISLRTREIAIRLAIGASPSRVLGEMVLGLAKWCAPGLVLGLLLSAAFTSLFRQRFVEIGPSAPGELVLPASILATALLAALLAPVVAAVRRRPADVLLRGE